MDIEIWKPIPSYETLYEISNNGVVKSLRTGAVKCSSNNGKYKQVTLTKNGTSKTYKVHRLVAITFIPNPDNLPCVNHKDECQSNNNVNNLEWCSQEYNVNYSIGKRNNCGKWRKVYCPELNKTFPTLASAAKEVGVTIGAIWHAVQGNCKTIKGYHFEYADINQQ